MKVSTFSRGYKQRHLIKSSKAADSANGIKQDERFMAKKEMNSLSPKPSGERCSSVDYDAYALLFEAQTQRINALHTSVEHFTYKLQKMEQTVDLLMQKQEAVLSQFLYKDKLKEEIELDETNSVLKGWDLCENSHIDEAMKHIIPMNTRATNDKESSNALLLKQHTPHCSPTLLVNPIPHFCTINNKTIEKETPLLYKSLDAFDNESSVCKEVEAKVSADIYEGSKQMFNSVSKAQSGYTYHFDAFTKSEFLNQPNETFQRHSAHPFKMKGIAAHTHKSEVAGLAALTHKSEAAGITTNSGKRHDLSSVASNARTNSNATDITSLTLNPHTTNTIGVTSHSHVPVTTISSTPSTPLIAISNEPSLLYWLHKINEKQNLLEYQFCAFETSQSNWLAELRAVQNSLQYLCAQIEAWKKDVSSFQKSIQETVSEAQVTSSRLAYDNLVSIERIHKDIQLTNSKQNEIERVTHFLAKRVAIVCQSVS